MAEVFSAFFLGMSKFLVFRLIRHGMVTVGKGEGYRHAIFQP
jgi:hypothetical protein